jgi:hypothetical protein
MKRSFSEMSDEVLIDIKDDISNIQVALEYIENKQYDDNQALLLKFRILEFMIAVKIFIIWCLILKVYK